MTRKKSQWYHLTQAQVTALQSNEPLHVSLTVTSAVQSAVYMAQNWGNVPQGVARSQAKALRNMADLIELQGTESEQDRKARLFPLQGVGQ